MERMERNVINSFRLVKKDIILVQNALLDLKNAQGEVLELLTQMQKGVFKSTSPKKKIVKKKNSGKKTSYLASKTGKKFHQKNCPFAQNIKPKTKITFKSKTTALNKGYKPCNCVK